MPLIVSLPDVSLHGLSIDNVRNFGPGAYSDKTRNFPAIVLTPQASYNTLWDAPALLKMADGFLMTGRVNKKRVYAAGAEMGAFSAFHLACVCPEKIAAIVSVNGGGNHDKACVMKKIPARLYHSVKQVIIPMEHSKEMADALQECGNRKVNYTLYTDLGPDISAVVFGDKRLYTWLFGMRK
jgi:predicted peptidase